MYEIRYVDIVFADDSRYLDLAFSMWRRAVQLYSKFKTFEPLVIAKLVFLCNSVAEVPYHLISGSPLGYFSTYFQVVSILSMGFNLISTIVVVLILYSRTRS